MEWYFWVGVIFFLFLGFLFLVPTPRTPGTDWIGAIIAWALAFLVYIFGKIRKRWFDALIK